MVLSRIGPERLPHLAADLTVELADAVAHPAIRRANAVMLKLDHHSRRITAERQKSLPIDSELLPVACEMLLDELEGKRRGLRVPVCGS